jgi:hypothetical protein
MFDTTHQPSPLTYSKNHTNTPHVHVQMSHVQVSYMFIHAPCPCHVSKCPMFKFHTCSYIFHAQAPCPSFIHVHTCPLPLPCVKMSHVQVSYMFIHIPCPGPMSKFHTCSYMSHANAPCQNVPCAM